MHSSRQGRVNMFKGPWFVLLLSLLLWQSSALSADAHLFFGSWQVDVAKLSTPNPPASVTITWADAGDGRVKMSLDILDSRGTKSHQESIFALDGSPSRVAGSLDVDVVSMTTPIDRVLVMAAGMAGNPSNTRVFTVSDDGKQMSETIVGRGPGNIPATRVNSWTKR